MPTKQPRTTARKTTRPLKVWVVIHCEFFPRRAPPCDNPFVDEMVFQVSSSLKAAEKYIKPRGTSDYGWWMVQERLVDQPDSDADDVPPTHYYNYRGQPRKSPPHDSARRAYNRWQGKQAREQQAS